MKEFVEKLIERLEEYPHAKYKDDYGKGFSCAINLAIENVNQLAEKYEDCVKMCSKDCEVYDKENHYCPKWCKVIRETVEELKEYYNQDSTKNNQGWILCSERLPEIDNKAEFYQTVIVTKNKYGEVGFGFHDGVDWYVFNDYTTEWDKYKNIKAWQPLPEPYKPEEKKRKPETNFYAERFNRVL